MFNFGFIPLGDMSLSSCVQPTDSGEDLIALHTTIISSGQYNFINKQMNIMGPAIGRILGYATSFTHKVWLSLRF